MALTTVLTEEALRGAVVSSDRGLSSGGGQAAAIGSKAIDRVSSLVKASGDSSSISSQLSVQEAAISLAITGLVVAFEEVTKLYNTLKNDRLAFEKEEKSDIATFTLPTNQVEKDFKQDQIIIKKFYESLSLHPTLLQYSGIHTAKLSEEKNVNFITVLPFWMMSKDISYSISSRKVLDKKRGAISSFLKTILPDCLENIDAEFQSHIPFFQFFIRWAKGSNYLNNLRAPRFIMMCLGNILWNLQYPVDEEGFRLSFQECIKLCDEVEPRLYSLLDVESPIYLGRVSGGKALISLVLDVKLLNGGLRTGYEDARLHELNIDEVTESAHRALRTMDQGVFELLYKRYDRQLKVSRPDKKAASELDNTVRFLNELIDQYPELGSYFILDPKLVKISPDALMNNPPRTVVDVLIAFCHLSESERDNLLEKIKKSKLDTKIKFARTLEEFDKKYISPIERVSREECGAWRYWFNTKPREVSVLTAKRLLPLIALMIQDFGSDVDTPLTLKEASESKGRLRSGIEQVQAICKSADKMATLADPRAGYYQWAISPFVSLTPFAARQLDELPRYQYRLTQVTKLMDSVSEIVNEYRNFLQYKIFQDFLRRCMKKAKTEHSELEKKLTGVDKFISKDDTMSWSIKSTLRVMTGHLDTSLSAFNRAISNFDQKISDPDFTQQQKLVLAGKLDSIHQQFQELFDEDSGLIQLMGVTTTEVEPLVATLVEIDNRVNSCEVMALRNLVMHCYDALSYFSQQGDKGVRMLALVKQIENAHNFTIPQFKLAIMELVRETASYRPSWFAQAAYGQTCSAKVLIAAIKDPLWNQKLPLAATIFNRPHINCLMDITEEDVLQQLRTLRLDNQWEESSNQMHFVPAF